MSAYKLSHRFTGPLAGLQKSVPDDIITSQQTLDAKWRLSRIPRLKSTIDKVTTAGDLAEVFIKTSQRKTGCWTSALTVLAVEKDRGMITVPGADGMTVKAALASVRLALNDESLAQFVGSVKDVLDNDLEDLIMMNSQMQTSNELLLHSNATTDEPHILTFDSSFRNGDAANGLISTPQFNAAENNQNQDENESIIDAASLLLPEVGDKIEVFWPLDKMFFPCFVAEEKDNAKTVVNEDGGIGTLDFPNETWRYGSSAKLLALFASSLCPQSEMSSVLNAILDFFKKPPFLRHEVQAFPQLVLENAFDTGVDSFKKPLN